MGNYIIVVDGYIVHVHIRMTGYEADSLGIHGKIRFCFLYTTNNEIYRVVLKYRTYDLCSACNL